MVMLLLLNFANIHAVRTGINWKKSSLSALVVVGIAVLQTTILSTTTIESGGCALAYMGVSNDWRFLSSCPLRWRRFSCTSLRNVRD
jgi:hypothetical protein